MSVEEECIDRINKALNHPMVKFLRAEMEKSGCPVLGRLLKATHCKSQNMTGGYASGVGIVFCCNHLKHQDDINQVLIHELIHAYDDCRVKELKWSDCAHQACSEIRANHLSGDCHFKRELLRGYLKVRGHEQDCVRRRAFLSTKNNRYCSEAAAKDAVEAVWDICYNDSLPFEKAP